MSKSKLCVFSIVALLLLSFSVSFASAQYTATKVTDITIGSGGAYTATESEIGVTYDIQGVAGSTGTVTASLYVGNPQATATIPSGIGLSHFIAITFDMAASDFTQATITIKYSDSEVTDLKTPYNVYKYLPDVNGFVVLPTTVDTTAKTVTVTLTSIDDPLLAIGGLTTTQNPGLSLNAWIIIIVSVIVVAVLALFIVIRWRKM